MEFNSNQIKMAKNLAKISTIYRDYFLCDKKYKNQFKEENGLLALKIFLDYYAYQRQGAPDYYSEIAQKCIKNRYPNHGAWKIPTKKDAKELWRLYRKIAKEEYELIDENKETGRTVKKKKNFSIL